LHAVTLPLNLLGFWPLSAHFNHFTPDFLIYQADRFCCARALPVGAQLVNAFCTLSETHIWGLREFLARWWESFS